MERGGGEGGNGEGMQVSCTLYFKRSIGWQKNCYFENGIKQQILINIIIGMETEFEVELVT